MSCTVAPEDELLVARLEAPLADVNPRIAISYLADARAELFRDIRSNAASGDVVVAPKIARIRAVQSHQHRLLLVAVGESGERAIGDYTRHDTAHAPT